MISTKFDTNEAIKVCYSNIMEVCDGKWRKLFRR